jgi:5-formyltetrahydrofolate cyclo-ligase
VTAELLTRKRELRARIKAARSGMPAGQRRSAAARITAQLHRIVSDAGARCVSAYLSSPTEPDTRGFLAWARGSGVRVLLPISRPARILDWAEDDGREIPTPFGVPETAGVPLGPRAIDEAEVIFAPAAAVGRDGTRLGWGLGYFDTMLAGMRKCPRVYAVLFDGELLEEVPREPHDHAVDGVVTPERIVRFD